MTVDLFSAARAGDLTAVQAALGHPEASLTATAEAGDTALHIAARAGHLDVVNALLAAGAPVDTQNELGWTPLFCAAYNSELDCGFAPIVKRLIEAGARVDQRIAFGITPLMLAAGAGEAAVCQELLAAGADIKAVNESGRTALMMVKERHFVDVINLLHEAEGYVMETEGVCPSTGKRAPGDTRVVQLIRKPFLHSVQ